MSRKLKSLDQKTVTVNGHRYNRALETPYLIYFTDSSDGIAMFRKQDSEYMGGGAMVENSLIEDIEENSYTWASKSMQINIQLIKEEAEKNKEAEGLEIEPF